MSPLPNPAAEPAPTAPGSMRDAPEPDPTIAATALIDRAAASMKVYVDGQVAVVRERLDGIDTATELRLGVIAHLPAQIDEKVEHLEQLVNVRFDSIDKQFRERDTRADRESRDGKTAVDAAFSAQKEAAAKAEESGQKAIDKSEKATAETLGKLSELFKTTTDGLATSIGDLKSRMDRMEAQLVGALAQRNQSRENVVDVRAWIALGITLVLAAITIVGFVIANSGTK